MELMQSEPVAPNCAPAIRGYAAVCLDVIRAMEPFELDLFVGSDDEGPPVLFRSGECECSLDEALECDTARSYYIRAQDKPQCDAKLQRHLEQVLQHEGLVPASRIQVLMDVVSVQIETAFQRIEIDATVADASRIARQITALVTQSTLLPDELLAIAQYNADTFAHILNTSTYGVLLAQGLGIQNQDELERIAVGILLHDVGKRFLPARLIGSATHLTSEERRLIEEHPQKGYEALRNCRELDFGQLMMVYQHHERIDGSGYPVGVVGEEIHPWARLCAVVDIFEALTGKRSYRAAVSMHKALSELDNMAGARLDKEMVLCWKSLLSPQA